MEAWHWWLIAAIVLMTLEILTADFLLATFAIACLASSIAAGLDAGFSWQLWVFAIAGLLTFIFVRPAVRRYLHRSSPPSNTNVDGMIGLAGKVTEAVGSEDEPGRVKVGGEVWRAVSGDGSPIEEGALVEVESVDSATLTVRPRE